MSSLKVFKTTRLAHYIFMLTVTFWLVKT